MNIYWNEYFTYKPCSGRAAVLQLGHLGELVGEENVLWYRWDLEVKHTEFNYIKPP